MTDSLAENGVPTLTFDGTASVNTDAAPLSTSTPASVVVTAALVASVAVTDQEDNFAVAVSRVTMKVWLPASAAAKVESAGSTALGSVAVRCTGSVKFVATFPNASRAVTTIGNGVPATTCCGPVEVIDVT